MSNPFGSPNLKPGDSNNQSAAKKTAFNALDLWGSSSQQPQPNIGSFNKNQNKPSFDAFSDFGNFGSV